MPSWLVTGGCGFIGSHLVEALLARGDRVRVLDNLSTGRKDNLPPGAELVIGDVAEPGVAAETAEGLDGVFHLAAVASVERCREDWVGSHRTNLTGTIAVFDAARRAAFPNGVVYASSAAVYGGSAIFRESVQYEQPLNIYGYSKFLFDQVVRRRLPEANTQVAGFRYFNVYGVNEDHKSRMASVAWHFFNQYRRDGRVRLFEGSGGYPDGEQHRDFVSVEDVVKVNLDFLGHPERSGIVNLGTGRAQTFNEVAEATINALRLALGESQLSLEQMKTDGLIEYIPFPDALKGKYQHFTQADINALRESGYTGPFMSVGEGIRRYMSALLDRTLADKGMTS